MASVAAQAGLSQPWSQTPKTGFSRDEAQLRYEPRHDKTCFCCMRTTKAHPCSLINAFVVRYLDGIIPILAGERGGSVVDCRTPEREVGGSKPTAAVLCP